MKIQVVMSFRAIFFLLISLVHGGRCYDVTNNDDNDQLNEKWQQRSYYDVTYGKTINNLIIKEIWTLEADVTNNDDGKMRVDIEDGGNAVKENWASEIYFAKGGKRKVNNNRKNIAKGQRKYKKRKADDVPVVMTPRDVAERNQRPNTYYGRKSDKIRTKIKDAVRTQRLNDVRKFTEGRYHNGWPVNCVERIVSYCSDIKYRGRKIPYCLYKLKPVCISLD